MIFVGAGALLRRAILHTVQCRYIIEQVFTNSAEVIRLCNAKNIPWKTPADINDEIAEFNSEDKVVLSINNGQIFRSKLLSLRGFRFYNIHNGILPSYRGLPEICIIYAMLNKEKSYGVSLHSIDTGIDTGICHAIKEFSILEEDTFQSVMQRSLEYCDLIFKENLHNIMTNNLEMLTECKGISKLYTYRDLDYLEKVHDKNLVARVLLFGLYASWFRKALEKLRSKIA
jgi:methionyl-tRNA formyltransferase